MTSYIEVNGQVIEAFDLQITVDSNELEMPMPGLRVTSFVDERLMGDGIVSTKLEMTAEVDDRDRLIEIYG